MLCYNIVEYSPSAFFMETKGKDEDIAKKKKHNGKWKSHKVVNQFKFLCVCVCVAHFWLFNLSTSHGDHAFWKFKHSDITHFIWNTRYYFRCLRWEKPNKWFNVEAFMHFDTVKCGFDLCPHESLYHYVIYTRSTAIVL